jgi:hypothetical protein
MGASFRGARPISEHESNRVMLDGLLSEVHRIARRAQYDLLRELQEYAALWPAGPESMIKSFAGECGFALPELKPGGESMPAVGSNRGSDWGRDETSTAERDKDREVRTDPDIRGVEKGRRETDGSQDRRK